MSNNRLAIRQWMVRQRRIADYDTATSLAEAAFAQYPELDEQLGFEIAQEVFYGR